MSSPVNYLIIHGSRGSPEGNWFPWLKNRLEQRGGKVFVPRFPTPEHQSLDTWLTITDKALSGCAPSDTILIGHSSGSICVLRMAERTTFPYRAVFSICPFSRDLGLADYDALNKSFVTPAFDWQRVRRGAQKITCFAGDNDPYVPLAYSREVAEKLNSPLEIVKNGGHLNSESGYFEFPLLFQKICES